MNLPTTQNSTDTLKVSAADAPSLFVAYIKSELELGETEFLFGLSYADGATRQNHIDDEEPTALSARSRLYGADLLVTHHFSQGAILTLQSEWISREMSGDTYSYDAGAKLTDTPTDKKQSGFCTQVVYDFNKHYSSGLRYDSIYKNRLSYNSVDENLAENMNKYSAMITYKPLESLFFRVQYSHNDALYNESMTQESIETLTLQANITIGKHSAHLSHHEHH